MEGGSFVISFIYKVDCSFNKTIDVFLIQLVQNIALCSVVCTYRQDIIKEHYQSIQCLDFYSPLGLGGRTARSLQRNV